MEDINAFEKYLRNERNLSEQTIIPYKKDLIAFRSYLESLEEPPTW